MKNNSDICISSMKYIPLFFNNKEGKIYLKNKEIKDNQIPKYNRKINFNKKKSNLRKEIKILNFKSHSNLILLILLLFPICLAYKKTNLRKLNNISEITLTIDGIGEQKIIYNSFYATPSKVIVNDIIMEEPGKTVNCTKEKGNIIKMEFNESLNTAFNMFSRLSNITKIDLSKFDASQITDMKFMFNECQNLEYINLTNINTSSVTDMGDLFCKCTKLTSIDLSYFDTSSVTNFVFLFYHCSSLKSVNLSNFDTKKAENMNSVFNGCSNLTSIDLSSFNTSSVKTMYGMFKDCFTLTSINLQHFDTSSLTSMASMFHNCSSITSLDISNFKTSKIDDMGNLFNGCNNLVFLNISNFNTSSVKNMEFMFSYCKKLTSLNLKNFNTSKTTNMKNMFNDCKSLTSLDLSNFNTNLTQNMQYMFSGCEKLKSLNLSNFNSRAVTAIQYMFNECKELKYLDLSNFQASLCTNMQYMFSGCEQLTELNLSSFNTIQASNMRYMFYNCKNLKTLDISNFVTSKVSYMQYMFSNCEKIVSLDISNFDLSSISRVDNMFSNCTSLVYLNLNFSDIPENKIKNKTDIFEKISTKLKYCLNENNTDIFVNDLGFEKECSDNCFIKNKKLIVENEECIDNCQDNSLFKFEYNNICYMQCPQNTHNSSNYEYICEKDLECPNYSNLDNSRCFDTILDGYYLKDTMLKKIDKCHPDCKTCDKKETIDNTNCKSCYPNKYLKFGNCVSICENGIETDEFGNEICKCPLNYCKECNKESYELNLCISCKEGFYPKFNDKDNILNYINCYKEPEGYYLYNEEIYKTCHINCKNCSGEGTPENNNCIECKSNYELIKNPKNINNCYQKCNTFYYFDELNNYQCTKDGQCPKKQQKLIPDKKKCIDECKNDDIYRYDYNNTCYKNCPKGTIPQNYICIIPQQENTFQNCSAQDLFITKSCGSGISSSENKDQIIKNIQEDIQNRRIDELLDNITKTKEDLTIKENDTIYQITTTENQNNNDYKNISSVKLGDCERRLKDIYGISQNISLIMFKIDYYSPGLLIPIVSYEIFHPENKSKLDLNHCKDILVELNIPVSIDEKNLFKHDPNSEYYTDKCFPSSSEDGIDILMNDRINEYSENNLSLCQNNCTFTGYETGTKKALCNCEIKTKINLISEIIEDKNKLSSYNFSSTDDSSSNIVTMKCIYTLFTKDGLKSNIGSYILLFSIFEVSVSSILFYKAGFTLLENDINLIIKEKEKNIGRENNNFNIYKYKGKTLRKKKSKTKTNKKRIKVNFPPKKKKLRSSKPDANLSKNNEIMSQTKLKLKDIKILFNFQKRKSVKSKSSKNKNKNENKKEKPEILHSKTKPSFFTDYELNNFTYEEALVNDKRTCMQYYLSLIKTKHPIIFSFVPIKDYNVMIIKICLFFLTFCIYYLFNRIFFTNATIHKIYEDGGAYNLSYLFPKIVLSFISAHIFSTILIKIFLSERNIVEIKKEKILDEAKDKVDKVKRNLIIKYIIFFVSGILLLIFIWYYLSSFGAVYQNSQLYLIKNTFISYLIGLIYPFFINIIPSILRIISLNDTNRMSLYKISKYLQIL